MDDPEKPQPLEALTAPRLIGSEPLHDGERTLPLTVLDFWQWSASDLVSNLTRGRLAEFIVAHALGIDVRNSVRNEWDAFDLMTPDGVRVEVKASGYVQSWRQKQLSKVGWRIGPTRQWEANTGLMASDAGWHADVYVLALFHPKEKSSSLNPLDVSQWTFFVLPAGGVRERTWSSLLSLTAVASLGGKTAGFEGLAGAVRNAAKRSNE